MLEVSLTPTAETAAAARRSQGCWSGSGTGGAAFSMLLLAYAELQLGGPGEAAARLCDEAHAIFRELGDAWGDAYAERAGTRSRPTTAGCPTRPRRPAGGPWSASGSSTTSGGWPRPFSLAESAKARGDLARAEPEFEAALAAARDGGPLYVVLASLVGLGGLLALRGDDGRAAALHAEATALGRRTGERRLRRPLQRARRGRPRRGELGEGRQLHTEALALFRDLGVGWASPTPWPSSPAPRPASAPSTPPPATCGSRPASSWPSPARDGGLGAARRGPGRRRGRPGRGSGAAPGHRRGDPRAHRRWPRPAPNATRPAWPPRPSRPRSTQAPWPRPAPPGRPWGSRRPSRKWLPAPQPGQTIETMARTDVPPSAADDGLAVGRQASVEPDPTDGPSPFPPIAEYAFLSDCESNALVAPSGNVEWLCLPRPDGRSVFASMLDRAAGSFGSARPVTVPAGRRVPAGHAGPGDDLAGPRRLGGRPGRAVRRPLVPPAAPLEDPRAAADRRGPTHPAPHGEVHHRQRRAEPGLRAGVRLRPHRGPAGSTPARATARPSPTAARATSSCGWSPTSESGSRARSAHARTTLREGDRAFAALCWPRSQWSASEEYWAERAPPANAEEAFERVERTAEFWQHWINQGVFPEHPWQSYLQRSALTLKGLTYGPTGALPPRLPPRCPRPPAGSATTTTATPGSATPPSCSGACTPRVRARGQRLLLLRGRRLRRGGRAAPDHVRGRGDRAGRRGAAAPERLRGRHAGPDRQRGRQPEPARRLGGGAGLGLPAHQVP